MLKAEKRHTKTCKASEYDRNHTKCKCQYRAIGMLNGVFIRKALKTSNQEQAQKILREWEASGAAERKAEPIRIDNATASFMRDIEARNWQEPTRRKFKTLLVDRLQSYTTSKGYLHIPQLTLNVVTEFRATWKDAPLTAQKNLERLRMFFRFCVDREWITNNPAAKLKVKVQVKEKDPFGSEEWRRIKDAVFIYQDGHGRLGQANAEELLAFILVLRHSGLRISDAVKLERSQLVPSSNHDGFGLSVFQQKVQRTVYIPLPDGRHETDDVVAALRALPTKSERYFFWTGNGGLDTATTNWRARLNKLFKLAESSTGSRKPFGHRPHPHRFRHSFAAGYLLAGMPLKAVSLLLGHANTKVTEKHYAKFTLDQQRQLEDLTRQAWAAQAPKLQVIRGSKKKSG